MVNRDLSGRPKRLAKKPIKLEEAGDIPAEHQDKAGDNDLSHHSDGMSDDGEQLEESHLLDGESPVKVPRKGIKKHNFSRDQAAILKKWFIEHAQYPYLKDDSKRELS